MRNERFLRDLQPVVALWLTASLFMAVGLGGPANEEAQDPQIRGERTRAAVGLLKELVDQLEALLETWPNAVWLFFPKSGYAGRTRMVHEFYTHIYPVWFPEASRYIASRVRRIAGHRWCGVSRRIRKETHRTFRIWDQFKAGRKPIDIARREFPSRAPRRKWNRELMLIHRSLARACQLIYGKPLPTKRRQRRLLAFSLDDHLVRCSQCRSATTFEQQCQQARDYASQDQTS
jgi:hypothetical protein